MNRVGIVVTVLVAILVLNSCRTMNADECITGDWQAIGFEDGVQGLEADRLGDHRRACAEYGVTPDFQAYQSGRDQGLNQYCQPSRGFSLGENGDSYNGVCAEHQESDFLAAYNTGQQLYRMEQELNTLEREIEGIEREIARNDLQIKDDQEMLVADSTTAAQRASIGEELEQLSNANGYLAAQIEDLFEAIAEQEQRIIEYQEYLSSSGF